MEEKRIKLLLIVTLIHSLVSIDWRSISFRVRPYLHIAHSTLLPAPHDEYGDYNATNYDEWNQRQHNNAGVE